MTLKLCHLLATQSQNIERYWKKENTFLIFLFCPETWRKQSLLFIFFVHKLCQLLPTEFQYIGIYWKKHNSCCLFTCPDTFKLLATSFKYIEIYIERSQSLMFRFLRTFVRSVKLWGVVGDHYGYIYSFVCDHCWAVQSGELDHIPATCRPYFSALLDQPNIGLDWTGNTLKFQVIYV